jgi:hypothetical protein
MSYHNPGKKKEGCPNTVTEHPISRGVDVSYLDEWGSNRPAPVRACQFPFLHLNSNPLTAPTEIDLPRFHLLQQGGGRT